MKKIPVPKIEDEIGKRIEEIRKENKLSREKLAKESEKYEMPFCSKSIERWERKKAHPNYDHLYVLSKIFNIPIEYLLYGKNNFWESLQEERKNDYIKVKDLLRSGKFIVDKPTGKDKVVLIPMGDMKDYLENIRDCLLNCAYTNRTLQEEIDDYLSRPFEYVTFIDMFKRNLLTIKQ